MTSDFAAHPEKSSTRRTASFEDERLESLLDAALSASAPAHAPPPQLSERVLQRTPTVGASAERASGEHATKPHGGDGVLARIGPRRASFFALALAASLVALVTLGVVRFGLDPGSPAGGQGPADIAAMERELDRLAAADTLATTDASIESRIDALALHLDYLDTSDPWADPEAALVDAAISEQMLRESDEMYLMF